ncbi:MAG: hypothetical protein HY646_15585, partial [Acidobacteria bacterium]|nr:hypothetical protein [Acidobacteriota bacterium]
MNRRSFLGLTLAGALKTNSNFEIRNSNLQTRHVIFIVNGRGVRKKDYYENPSLARNVRRIAREGFVFEEDHCDTVSSHDAAFRELSRGLDYVGVESLLAVPDVLRKHQPSISICREPDEASRFEEYVRLVRRTDERIGTIFDWVNQDPYFRYNTAIVIRPDFGRDDEINTNGELHHSHGYYYTHRVASIFWGPGFSRGVDR